MAAPPTQDDSDEPDTVTFGIPAVEAEIDDSEVTFPADASEIRQAVGDPDIPYDPWGGSMSLSQAIQQSGKTHFETRQEFMNALHPVFEEKRESGGLGGWVRSILPF
ncbi:MAG: DUF5789 family protein [Halodesulfurarchaeum sp.]